jgi:ATP-dependent DNA helicase RecQ
MFAFCQGSGCRHGALARYFGQPYPGASCHACDVCLDEGGLVEAAPEAGLHILRAVAELRGRFGAAHLADVLTGAAGARIRALGHERLDAYGALRDATKAEVRGWIEQLIGQGFASRTDGEYPTVAVTALGARALGGETPVSPLRRAAAPPRPARRRGGPADAPIGPEADGHQRLFEALRSLRRQLAEERGVPPYVVFSDATLREMARRRPTTREELRGVRGVGDWKCEVFGDHFLSAIRAEGVG